MGLHFQFHPIKAIQVFSGSVKILFTCKYNQLYFGQFQEFSYRVFVLRNEGKLLYMSIQFPTENDQEIFKYLKRKLI